MGKLTKVNLVINSACNKRCSFCFAGEKPISEDDIMSIEYIEHLINKIDTKEGEALKIIGGEPTLHPDFDIILSKLKKTSIPITLVSNFLTGKESVWDAINDYLENKKMGFLINVSELTEGQFKRVSENIKKLNHDDFTLSYTLDIKRNFEQYKYWLDKFYSELGESFTTIRTSMPFPDPETNEDGFYLYKKYEYIDLLIEFIKWGMKHEIETTIDCGIFPCMFKDEKTEAFISKWINRLNYGCSSGAFDMFKNGDVILCYPGRDIKVNEKGHKNLESVYKQIMLEKSFDVFSKKSLPIECKECSLLGESCAGPCVGFLNKK